MSVRAPTILLAVALVSGCTVISGDALEASVDRTLVTNSIALPAPAPDPEQLSDSRTVRNAVSAADVGSVDVRPLPWSNAATGTSGTITSITEARDGKTVCRSFTTSRQRFDGVALYDGEACTHGEGEWVLTRFNEGR